MAVLERWRMSWPSGDLESTQALDTRYQIVDSRHGPSQDTTSTLLPAAG